MDRPWRSARESRCSGASAGRSGRLAFPRARRSLTMGKGNNSQRNDKKNKKPKQDKSKPAVKK
jgi:hypothetical protein